MNSDGHKLSFDISNFNIGRNFQFSTFGPHTQNAGFGPYHKNGPTDFSENYTPDRARVGLSGTTHRISDPNYPKKVIFEKPTFQKIAKFKKH